MELPSCGSYCENLGICVTRTGTVVKFSSYRRPVHTTLKRFIVFVIIEPGRFGRAASVRFSAEEMSLGERSICIHPIRILRTSFWFQLPKLYSFRRGKPRLVLGINCEQNNSLLFCFILRLRPYGSVFPSQCI